MKRQSIESERFPQGFLKALICRTNRIQRQIPRLFLQAAFFLILPFTFAHSRIPPGDTDYFSSSPAGDLTLLVSESYRKNFSLLRRQSRRFYKEYGLLFHDSPQSRSYLVFVSPKTQMMNGAGVVSPVPLVFVYSGPGEDINRTASHNWLQDVLAHETAHLYQMSAQTKFSSRLRLFFPPVFWIIHPNIYLNRLILEGNAVLLESLYGTGGRLFSGWAKAFVFRQLKADISLKRIFNDYNDLFSHQEKYLHGGWFFLFLLKETLKDSDDVPAALRKIHKIFARHKNHIFFPIAVQSLNRAFQKTFEGESFESLFEQYRQLYREKASYQKSAPEAPLFKSQTAAPLNSDEKQVYFLVSDGKSPPSLVTLDKETESFSIRKQDMPVGKVFFIDGDFYSAGTGQTESLKKEIALFKDGFQPLPKSPSRYVMDRRGGKTAAFDTGKGPFGFPLLINDSFYDQIHSTAILDENGRVYYFKQQGSRRVLFANKKPLYSFKGFYSFPIEAAGFPEKSDTLYFIGPTKHGSGLFAYETAKGRTVRLSPSDTIVGARRLKGDRFLVIEVAPFQYDYKIIAASPVPEEPFSVPDDFLPGKVFRTSRIKEEGAVSAVSDGFLPGKDRFAEVHPEEEPLVSNGFLSEKERLDVSEEEGAVSAVSDGFLPGKDRFAEDKPEEETLVSGNILPGKEQTNLSPPSSRYNPFLNLKFQDLTVAPLFGFSAPFFRSVRSRLRLTDPLQWNSASFFASWAAPPPSSKKSKKKPGAKAFRFHYLNKRRRLQWGLNFYFKTSPRLWIENKAPAHLPDGLLNSSDRLIDFQRDSFWESRGHYFSYYRFLQTQVSLNYLMWRRENQRLLFLSHFGYGKERFDFLPVRIKKEGRKISYSRDNRPSKTGHYDSGFWNHRGALQFEHTKKYSEAFGRHRHLHLSAYYDGSLLQKSGVFVFSCGGRAFFEKEAGREWFFSGGARIDRRLKTPFISRFFIKKEKGDLINSHTFFMPLKADGVFGADLIVKKALNQSLYSLKLPVSLKRWAPLAGAALVFIQGDSAGKSPPPDFNLKTLSPLNVSGASDLQDGSSPVFAHLFAGAEAEISLNYNADVFAGFSIGPIFEWANRAYFMERNRKIRRGVHTALSLKAVF